MILRCNQCPFTVQSAAVGPDGLPRNGWAILRAHVKAEHPAYLAALRASLLRWPDTLAWLAIAYSVIYILLQIVRAAV